MFRIVESRSDISMEVYIELFVCLLFRSPNVVLLSLTNGDKISNGKFQNVYILSMNIKIQKLFITYKK